MLKFECKKCGKCCEDFGKAGHNLPLFEWEADELKNIAKSMDLTLDIRPLEALLDNKSGFAITAQYGLFTEPCPFLKNKVCSIYESRPLVCRAFPIGKTLVASNFIDLSNFLHCENFSHKKVLKKFSKRGDKFKFKNNECLSKFRETYGECYDYGLQNDIIKHFIEDTIKSLHHIGKIMLINLNEAECNTQEILPFFRFLVKTNIMTDKEKEETINLCKDNDKLLKLSEVDK